MASLDPRLNPFFSIKECSSCGALYTADFCCSKGGLEDKILVPKPPQNCATCGDPVDGLYCRPCAFVRKCLNEGWYTIHDKNEILNTSESSNHNTNVVSAPQEPFVFNQDPGVNSSQSHPQINHNCCYKCSDLLDDIFCQRCTCKSCGNGAHIGYNCPPKAPIISNSEQCNQTINELPQTLPSVHPTYNSGDENSFTYDSKPNVAADSPNVFNPPPQPSIRKKKGELRKIKRLKIDIGRFPFATMMTTTIPLQSHPFYQPRSGLPPYVAITPVLSTEEPVDSLIMEDEHLDTILATESDEVKSSVENLVQIPNQFEGFSNSNDDSTSIDDDSFSIDDIDYVKASPPDSELVSLEEIETINSNPPPSPDFVTKSPSTFPNSFLEETNTFDNSIPESETFCFDVEENSSGSTTTRSDYSLPDYEAFYFDDDHIEEKSSGITTTHSDISLSKYDSFVFDLSNDLFPHADRSDFYHEEFTDELTHIISPPKYDCFYFKIEPELGEFTMDVVEDIFYNQTREPRVHVPNVLPTHPLTTMT
ncbi:hypothetical protein Tco_1306543 [Tanacetum coccineum]